MQFSINKTKNTAAIIIFLLMASITLIEMPVQPAEAQLAATQPSSGSLPSGVTADFTVATIAYMSIRPAVVGLGQTFIVNLFPIPAPNAARKFKDFKVTITKPDTTTEVVTMDSYVADGTAWFEYIANAPWHLEVQV